VPAREQHREALQRREVELVVRREARAVVPVVGVLGRCAPEVDQARVLDGDLHADVAVAVAVAGEPAHHALKALEGERVPHELAQHHGGAAHRRSPAKVRPTRARMPAMRPSRMAGLLRAWQ
jgi:hypothetical protein